MLDSAPQFEDRWYQAEAEASLFHYFEENRVGNPVIALPTGTGKSVVIGNFVRNVFRQFPNQRVMMLTHVKELIEQNAQKLLRVWPTAPLGIYSAGLKQRDVALPIVYGGVASVKNCIRAFGHRDLLLIDECHLLSPNGETMYQKVIAEMLAINPWLRVIGFTATAFRMKQGMITDDGIFTDICYNGTTTEAFNRLVAEGYISPPIPKRTDSYVDVENVKVVNGEFDKSGLAAAADQTAITWGAVKESVELAYNRQSWLMFAASIEHSEHIAEMLQSFGIVAAAVHSGLPAKENDARIAAFKRGEIRAMVNMGKLTTGFDHPPIDFIGMLRPTMSPGLWVQMIGRGTRPSPETFKSNCLVADFARNTPRLGPINDPVIPRKPGKGGGDAPVRICDNCGCYNHASVRWCINCGQEFQFETKIFKAAGSEELLRGDAPIVQYFPVNYVTYSKHIKIGSTPCIKVSYFCGYQQFNEYIHPEAPRSRGRLSQWWMQRHNTQLPATVDECLHYGPELRMPSRIRIHVNLKFPQVLGYEF